MMIQATSQETFTKGGVGGGRGVVVAGGGGGGGAEGRGGGGGGGGGGRGVGGMETGAHGGRLQGIGNVVSPVFVGASPSYDGV
ncbi:hypothetical protein CBR_g7981 [Chara braunii]|uniref:Uncharacterized protein n=1 Tax=Chara braunii TaxID=69332 RepID=A0A388KKV2_CHABU|nr:hypothetical protein CBR_g7981 [Chara braunii]|eukprot:GBG70681.1 hypothetical protein CBR_g7981 [Chara braunii]